MMGESKGRVAGSFSTTPVAIKEQLIRGDGARRNLGFESSERSLALMDCCSGATFCLPDVNQYARYGKLRAEDDARRFVTQQAELERQKDALRRDLHALRADRKNLKESKDAGE